jgi:hypothetical protein
VRRRREKRRRRKEEELREGEHGEEKIAVTARPRQKSATMTSPYDSDENSPL